jgi:S1 RNA binding domain protein
MAIEVGNMVEGKVVLITGFGAFVELTSGETGLIHISEVDNSYVRDVKDFLKENDKVKAKVISIKENGKIDLSIKQLQAVNNSKQPPVFKSKPHSKSNDSSFEEKMKSFLKSSEEKLSDLKKSQETKRS